MKKLSLLMAMFMVALASTAQAGITPNHVDQLLKQKMDCYRAHHQLMDKPSLQTLDACWRAHRQLMK